MGNSFDFETIKANVIEQMKASPPLSLVSTKKRTESRFGPFQ